MSPWVRGVALGLTLGALVALGAAGGCSSRRKNEDPAGGGGGGGGGPRASALTVEIQSAEVPASGNPTVRFRLTDAAGKPIDDLAAEIASDAAPSPKPAPRLTPHFTLAQLEDDGTYTSYYEVTVAAAPYTDAGGVPQTPTGSAVQPRTEPPPGAFPAAQLAAGGDGVYTYTFSTPTTDPSKLDRARTHTVGVYGTRTVPVGGKEVASPASATLNFVPAGGAASRIEMVTDAACNACHTVLEAHDRRRGTQLCITCHAGDRTTPYADPETQNTLDFRVMIHRIHAGQAGYHLVGFQQADADFSDVTFPRDLRGCTACHSGANGDTWKTRPSARACIACHQLVRFDGSGSGTCTLNHLETVPCNHPRSVSATASCAACHVPGGALGADTVHVSPAAVASATFAFQITGVTVAADRTPTVQFRVLQDGAAMALDADPWIHGAASRLFVDIGWPSSEYDNRGSGQPYAQPVQLDALPASAGGTATPVAGQANVYQVVSPTPIPAGVTDVTVALEGHPAIPDPYDPGQFLRVPVVNDVKYVDASGAAGTARRQVVAVERCNACHALLSAHGQNRTGTTQVCVVCHNPAATDQAQVPAGQAAEPIDFKVLIHVIHADKIRQGPLTVFGFGGTASVFPLGFPGEVGNCNICHVNGSYQLPLPAVVKDTIVPAGGSTPRTLSVCTSCHDTVRFDGSASQRCGAGVAGDCNHSGGQQVGDAICVACHGAGAIADVATVHPITALP